jgi:hypothetical protein
MTAIFVYVETTTVFIASDTKRGLLGLYTVAAKTQRWSPNVLVAQTGSGEGLQRLFGEMLSWQHRIPNSENAAGVNTAFDKVGPFKRETEIYYHSNQNRNMVNGTLVIAAASKVRGVAATIATIDSASQTKTNRPGPIYADGSDPSNFLQIAQAEYASSRQSGSSFDLADWAIKCIDQAMHTPLGQGAVDWPMDLTLLRPENGVHTCIAQRIARGQTPSSLFQIQDGKTFGRWRRAGRACGGVGCGRPWLLRAARSAFLSGYAIGLVALRRCSTCDMKVCFLS